MAVKFNVYVKLLIVKIYLILNPAYGNVNRNARYSLQLKE